METKHLTQEELLAEWNLIQKAQKDPAFFAELYSKYFRAIFLFIYRRVNQEAIAEDLCTIVFSKALYKLHLYSYKGVPYSAWLYKIALREVQQYYRKTQREQIICFSAESLAFLCKNIHEEEQSCQLEEHEQLLFKALEQIKPEEMLFIEMRFFENRSFKEIAEIQQISENNAKVKTYRIIGRLRKIILTNKHNG